MKKIFLFSAFIFSFLMNAQTAPIIEWQKSFGGSGQDLAASVKNTTDGGYIICGGSKSIDGDVVYNYGDSDFWILKINSAGNVQWQKSLGGSGSDFAQSIQQTTDGGYIVVGNTTSNDGDVTGNHGGTDYWIVKLDNSGNIQWQRSLGGSDNDSARSVQQTMDGGYVVVGKSRSNDGDVSGNHGGYDYWVVKLNNTGILQWQKSLGGSSNDDRNSFVQQTLDGGYIIATGAPSVDGDISGNHGSYDGWIVKLDNSGNIQWQKSFGGSDVEEFESIQQTLDGGYIAVGNSSSNDGDVTGNHGSSDSWILKIDNNGVLQWQKSFGGSNLDEAHHIQQTSDGGYIVTGVSASIDGDVTGNHGSLDYWIMKINNNGIIQWQKSLGGSKLEDYSFIQQTPDNGYIISGISNSNDGDVTGNHGDYDYWIVKLSAEGLATQEIQNTKINLYPNPVKDVLHFSEEVSNIRIADMSGRIIKEIPAKGNSVNVSNLAKGVYMVTAITKNEEISRKIVKE